jgi:hypothetical protein
MNSTYGVAVGNDGSRYITGGTTSTNLPASNGYSTSISYTEDAFVSKLTPDGAAVVYTSTEKEDAALYSFRRGIY